MNNFMQFKNENRLIRNQEYMINDFYYLNKYQWLDTSLPMHSESYTDYEKIEYSDANKSKKNEQQYFEQNDLVNTQFMSKRLIQQFLVIGIVFGVVLITLNMIQMNSSENSKIANGSIKQNQRISINQEHLLAE